MNRYLQSAINLANNFKYDECLSYRHCAVVVRGGAVLSVGYNHSSKNSFVDDVVRRVGVKAGHDVSTHAEMAAVLSVRNKIDLTGAKMFVARIKPSGVGMSKPCALCQDVAKRYGIKKVYFTIDDNSFGVCKP